MNPKATARRLRRNKTLEARQLWLALRAGRFAGFKFRREHSIGIYFLDFYCPIAKLSVELDGFQHGLPHQQQHDAKRKEFLNTQGIEELRFWNHQWLKNRERVLLEIWNALHRRTGCVAIVRKTKNHHYIPPQNSLIKQSPLPNPLPARSRGEGKN